MASKGLSVSVIGGNMLYNTSHYAAATYRNRKKTPFIHIFFVSSYFRTTKDCVYDYVSKLYCFIIRQLQVKTLTVFVQERTGLVLRNYLTLTF